MKLTNQGLRDRECWIRAGVVVPGFDREAAVKEALANPTWVHFGAGSLARSFHARLQQSLLERGLVAGGMIVAETFDYEIIDRVYDPFDDLAISVTLKPDGTMENEVVASIALALRAGRDYPEDVERLIAIFKNPSLQMLTFTITEKGYALTNMSGEYTAPALADFEAGPDSCTTAMGWVTSLLYERYKAGGHPIAAVSTDNCSHNGEKLKNSVTTMARKWRENEFVDDGFIDWLCDEKRVSFPWSMIDKITPRPAPVVKDELTRLGIEDMDVVVTRKNSYVAPFVNSEQPQYLVIEDRFPNGRPPLEEAGVYLTDRDTVNDCERMKVTTCLNPLHTALAVYGCLLGYTSIAEEMKDEQLKSLVGKIGREEGMKVVVKPGILDPEAFIDEVIDARFPNPFIPDTPQRIACDTSQKVAIRFGETIKAYVERSDLEASSLTYIPLAIAGWLRYLIAYDDCGKPFQPSPDPMLDTLRGQLSGVTLGNPDTLGDKLDQILSNPALFGSDLVSIGMDRKIITMVREMLAGPGAVRETLRKYVG